jgi:hypothetical protein
MTYGDEVIDREAATRKALHGAAFGYQRIRARAVPRRSPAAYLTLFDPDTIYQHVRLGRNIGPMMCTRS